MLFNLWQSTSLLHEPLVGETFIEQIVAKIQASILKKKCSPEALNQWALILEL